MTSAHVHNDNFGGGRKQLRYVCCHDELLEVGPICPMQYISFDNHLNLGLTVLIYIEFGLVTLSA